MSTPQQPELHRSKLTPEMDADTMTARLDARKQPGDDGHSGPVPPGNRATTAGPKATDQDQPDLDRFAAKLGISTDDESGTDDDSGESSGAGILERLSDRVLRPSDDEKDRLRQQRDDIVRNARSATAGLLNRLANAVMVVSRSLEGAAEKVAADDIDLRDEPQDADPKSTDR